MTLYKLRSIVDFTEKNIEKTVKYWLDSTLHYDFTPKTTLNVNQFIKISDVITDDSGFKLFSLSQNQMIFEQGDSIYRDAPFNEED